MTASPMLTYDHVIEQDFVRHVRRFETNSWTKLSPLEQSQQGLCGRPYLDISTKPRFTSSSQAATKNSALVDDTTMPPALPVASSTLEPLGTIHQQQQSPLFRLPAELRLILYEHLFSFPTVAMCPYGGLGAGSVESQLDAQRDAASGLTLLATCRLAQHEAEHFFYSRNRLTVLLPAQLFANLNGRRRSAITRLILVANCMPAEQTLFDLRELRTLPNLRSLLIRRTHHVRRQDLLPSWLYFENMIRAVLNQMRSLEDLQFLTPGSQPCNHRGVNVRIPMEALDARLRNGVARRRKNIKEHWRDYASVAVRAD